MRRPTFDDNNTLKEGKYSEPNEKDMKQLRMGGFQNIFHMLRFLLFPLLLSLYGRFSTVSLIFLSDLLVIVDIVFICLNAMACVV